MIPEVPPLLHERLEAQYGAELAREIEAGYVRKRTTFRVNPLKDDRDAVLREIADAGIATEPIAWYDDAFLLPDGNEEQLRALPCYDAGAIYLQSLSSMLPALVLAPKAGETVLDMAAAPGGKTTQMAAMEDALDRWGFEVIRSREPGGCPISEKIRALLLDPENKAMDETTEAILYAAARAQHVRQVIRPALKAGKTVLCDRFVDSSVAYQGGGRQLGVDTVLNINRPAVDGTMPMLTVYLDIDREAALRRRAASSQLDRIEQADDAFRTRTEAAYHELIRREPERFIVVDAAKPAKEVSRDMTEKVIQRLMEAEA